MNGRDREGIYCPCLHKTKPAQDTVLKIQVRPRPVATNFKLKLKGLSYWKRKSNQRPQYSVNAVHESLT
jgi:hypothetical protein